MSKSKVDKINLKMMRYLSEKIIGQIKRFFISGVSSKVLEIGIFIVLTEWFNVWYVASNIIIYIITYITSFLLFNFWAFKPDGDVKKNLFIYTLLHIMNIVLTTYLLYVVTELVGVPYIMSKVIVTGACAVWTFILIKKLYKC